jgi:hypothetical protein
VCGLLCVGGVVLRDEKEFCEDIVVSYLWFLHEKKCGFLHGSVDSLHDAKASGGFLCNVVRFP